MKPNTRPRPKRLKQEPDEAQIHTWEGEGGAIR
jgi:hypothetical protein